MYLKFGLILTCVFIFSNAVLAQTNEDELNVLLEATTIVAHDSPLVYLRRSIDFSKLPKKVIDNIERGRFFETVSNGRWAEDSITGEVTMFVNKVDSLILSSKEKKAIISKLNKNKIWKPDLFGNSFRTEDFNSGFKMSFQLRAEKKSNNHNYVFSFSKPIFFRNNMICLLAVTALCGGECGKTNISFYRKKDNVWQRWIQIYGVDY